jgi:hypothetical protein
MIDAPFVLVAEYRLPSTDKGTASLSVSAMPFSSGDPLPVASIYWARVIEPDPHPRTGRKSKQTVGRPRASKY